MGGVTCSPHADPPPSRGSKNGAWLLAVAFGFAALFAFQRLSDMDAGWLLALGRLVAQGRFPHTNALAWTARDFPWYPTSWLFELALYGCDRALGVFGIQLFTFALTATTLVLSARAAEHAGASRFSARAAALLAFAVLWTRVVPRPHLVEYALLAFTLERATAAIEQRSARPLWLLPIAVTVWANAHQSAPFGVGLLALILLPAVTGRADFARRDRQQLALLITLCAAATLATPGFDLNVRDLLAHLSLSEYAPIQEYARPTLRDEPNIVVLALLALGAAAALPEARRWLLSAAVFSAAALLLGRRFGADAAIVGIVPIAILFDRIRPLDSRMRALVTGTSALGACLLLMAASRVPLTSLGAFLGATWENSQLPVDAITEMKQLHLDGRGFTAYRFGGYVAWTLPEVGDFQDSRPRAFPRAFWEELAAAQASPAAFRAYLDRWNASWALTTAFPDAFSGHGLLRNAPGWRLVSTDETAELYVRSK